MDETTIILRLCDIVKPIHNNDHIKFYAKHGLTMLMMYRASGDKKYLKQARLDYEKAKSIKAGFMRPLGAILNNAA